MKKYTSLFALTALIALSAFLYTVPAFSYLPQFAALNQPDHWVLPPQWRLNPNEQTVVGGATLANVLQDSFNAWTSAPNASVAANRGPDTTATAHSSTDGINLICFVCSSSDFGKGGDTLAITYDAVNQSNGQIVDSDIIFNPAITFLTNGAPCPSGKSCAELQTIATHEIGHLFGLDHSGVVSSVMYPFAADTKVTLGYDDVAGISNLYPAGSPAVQTGSISGTVRNATTGSGICGAHVFADSATSAIGYPAPIRKTPISALTRSDGTYTITGLPSDSYTVTAEPLNGPVSDDNISGYGPTFCGGAVPTNFTTRQH